MSVFNGIYGLFIGICFISGEFYCLNGKIYKWLIFDEGKNFERDSFFLGE